MSKLTVSKTTCFDRPADRYTVACCTHAGLVSMSMQFEVDHFLIASEKITLAAIEGLVARAIVAYQDAADCDCEIPEGWDGTSSPGLARRVMALWAEGTTRSSRNEPEEVYMPSGPNGGGEEPVGDLVKALESIPDPRLNGH